MPGVRNGPLIKLRLAASGVTRIATVPANTTWLIKTLHVLNGAGAKATGYLQLQNAAGDVFVVAADFAIDPNRWTTWTGWTTAGPGDQLYINTDANPIFLWLSGAELPGVIP